MIKLGNNEVLKNLTKTLTFVDTNADASVYAEGSTIALNECCSGELTNDPLRHGQFGPQGFDWQDLCKGPLNIATY